MLNDSSLGGAARSQLTLILEKESEIQVSEGGSPQWVVTHLPALRMIGLRSVVDDANGRVAQSVLLHLLAGKYSPARGMCKSILSSAYIGKDTSKLYPGSLIDNLLSSQNDQIFSDGTGIHGGTGSHDANLAAPNHMTLFMLCKRVRLSAALLGEAPESAHGWVAGGVRYDPIHHLTAHHSLPTTNVYSLYSLLYNHSLLTTHHSPLLYTHPGQLDLPQQSHSNRIAIT